MEYKMPGHHISARLPSGDKICEVVLCCTEVGEYRERIFLEEFSVFPKIKTLKLVRELTELLNHERDCVEWKEDENLYFYTVNRGRNVNIFASTNDFDYCIGYVSDCEDDINPFKLGELICSILNGSVSKIDNIDLLISY